MKLTRTSRRQKSNTVPVEFVGDAARFIRRISNATGRTHSDTGNMLIHLLQNMEQNITPALKSRGKRQMK